VQNSDQKVLSMLQRQAFAKWWLRFDTTKATGESVTLWFKTNQNFCRLQILKLANFSIKKQELQLP